MMLQRQAQVVVVGIRGAVLEELNTIATDRERNVFIVEDFDQLTEFEQRVSTAVCFAGRTKDENNLLA